MEEAKASMSGEKALPPLGSGDAVSLTPLDPAARRLLWIEVLVVAMVGVVPDLVPAVMDYLGALAPSSGEVIGGMVSYATRAMGVSAVVLYLMWRSGEGWPTFGFVRPHLGADLLLATVLLVAAYVGYLMYGSTIGFHLWELDVAHAAADDAVYESPETALEWALTVVAMVANGFAEEIVIWGFVFVRLRTLLGSAATAVLVASAVFASYHIYQGLYGAGAVFVYGLIHGVFFAALPRLWPLILAHAAWDILIYLPA